MNVKRVVNRVFLAGLILCVLLCAILAFSAYVWVRKRTAKDPWDRSPGTEGPEEWRWRELPSARIHEVVDARQPEAQALLEDVAAVPITEERAAEEGADVEPTSQPAGTDTETPGDKKPPDEMTPEQRRKMFENMTPEQREAFRKRMQRMRDRGEGPGGGRPGSRGRRPPGSGAGQNRPQRGDRTAQ